MTGLERALKRAGSPARAAVLARYFKTGPGEYAEGDRFLGLTVPQTRAIIRGYRDLPESKLVGSYLLNRDRSLLRQLAQSASLWENRIAIVATFAFIRRGDVQTTFDIAHVLIAHPHDLIHKAVGWMLREAGKQNRAALEAFLERHAATMPRTMLRYAIERFEPAARKRYLNI